MNDAKVALAVGGIALVVATAALVLALVERHRRRRIRLDGRAIHAGLQEYRAKTGTAGTLWSSSTTTTSPSATSMQATVTAAPTESGAAAETRCRSIYAHGGADHRCEQIAGHSGPHRAPYGVIISREDARFIADKLRRIGQTERVARLVDQLDSSVTEADWLQEAANPIGSVEVSEWSDDCYVPTPVARATAALLRAVADASWCACPSGTAAHDAALALADTILGGES